MRKEKRSEIIHDALNLLDDDMIEDVERLRENRESTSLKKTGSNKKKVFYWRRYAALAASICLLVIGGWAWENYIGPVTNQNSQDKNVVDAEKLDSVGPESDDMEHVGAENEGEDDISKGDMSAEENNPDSDGIDGVTTENEVELETEKWPVNNGDTPESMPTVLGDEYHLIDNYVSVSMLPNKIWVGASSETEALQQAVEIEGEYKEDMDKLVAAMSEANTCLSEEIPASDPDMIYHLFFERTDGTIIHCVLLEDGFLYYQDKEEICLILDRTTYATTFKILALHW